MAIRPKDVTVRWVERMQRQPFRRAIKYSPLPSQRRFHASKARFKGFSGPIGSGKSQALCQEAIRMSYLNPGTNGIAWGADLSDVAGRDTDELSGSVE